jgi:uncharacterized protein (DUF486 family)
MRTILLLVLSNVFMTIAWYGHLKQQHMPLWKAILISWGIAFFEYCLMVPLKMTQEVITLVVFTVFAVFYLQEPFHWRYLVSFALLLGAVYFMFKK